MITDIFTVICSDDVSASRDFYIDLLGFDVSFEADWYVQLQGRHPSRPQLGIVARGHESVPERFRQRPAGVLVSVEVDDVDAVHDRAVAAGLTLELTLRDEPWGQRHFITVDPDGVAVDVITPIAAAPEYAELYADSTPA